MVANLISKKLRCFIGSDLQGWSLSVGTFVAGYSSLDESGLIKISGTLTIQKNGLNPESINPRLNPSRWRPGQPVRIEIRNSAGTWVPHPLGYLHLLEEPDPPTTGEISLSVGCWLSWVDTFEFDDDQSGVAFGTAENCAAIATRLLEANEIPSANINLGTWPYLLAYPAAKTTGGSFVGQAGELAYSNDFRYLYQDASGVIQTAQLSTAAGIPVCTITLGVNDITYQWLKDPQSPVELVKCAGIGQAISSFASTDPDISTTFGNPADYHISCAGNGVIAQTTVTRVILPGPPITYITATAVEEIRSAWWREPTFGGSPCSLTPKESTTEIKTYDTSNRLSTVVTTYQQREAGVVLDPDVGLNNRTTKQVTTTYSYGANDAVESIREVEKQAEVILDSASSNRWNLRTVRDSLTTWQDKGGGLWRRVETIGVARIVADSSADKYQSNIWGLRKTVTPTESNTGKCQPPRTEYWEGESNATEKHYEGTATWEHPGGASGRTRKRLFTLPFGFSNAQCGVLAAKHRDLLVGRHNGAQFELPITDALLSAGPLFQVNVVDDGVVTSYLADGVSWAHEADKASVVCVGIEVGPASVAVAATAPSAVVSAVINTPVGVIVAATAPSAQVSATATQNNVTAVATAPSAQISAAIDPVIEAVVAATAPSAQVSAEVLDSGAADTRVTEAGNTRVTEAGNTRTTEAS